MRWIHGRSGQCPAPISVISIVRGLNPHEFEWSERGEMDERRWEPNANHQISFARIAIPTNRKCLRELWRRWARWRSSLSPILSYSRLNARWCWRGLCWDTRFLLTVLSNHHRHRFHIISRSKLPSGAEVNVLSFHWMNFQAVVAVDAIFCHHTLATE